MEDDRYYVNLAASFVQGKLGAMPELTPEEVVRAGLAAGLRLHKFKRNAELPRVKKALGILRGLAPASLLDIGSGRGTFLFPLLDSFSYLPVIAIDWSERRAVDIGALRRGGIETLDALRGDAMNLPFEAGSVDVVTLLEVMEHLDAPERAAAEAVRVARHFVVISVPSKEDDNPEHIHLFERTKIEEIFQKAGAKNIKFDFVLNHILAVAKV
jgi:ubiquinone/menaquinone biosynthesis C-methylase UbiE